MINLFLIILILNFFIIFFYKPISKLYNLFDYPDHKRKIHNKPIPLLGGLILLLNIFFIILSNYFSPILINFNFFGSINNFYYFFIVFISFFVIGYLDDKHKINANLKLILTSLFIIFLIYYDENILLKNIKFTFINHVFYLGDLSYFITLVCFLLFINAFNMLDGINGQAAFYAIFILLILILNNIISPFLLSFLIMLTFFLMLNLKNKIFLGDNGTLPLGFMISYLFLKSYNNLNEVFLADEIFLIMSIPGYELFRLAIQRLINKKHPFYADNNHIHHLLLKKYKFIYTFFIIQLLLIIPYLSFLLFNSFLFSLSLSVTTYAVVIYLSYKKNYNV